MDANRLTSILQMVTTALLTGQSVQTTFICFIFVPGIVALIYYYLNLPPQSNKLTLKIVSHENRGHWWHDSKTYKSVYWYTSTLISNKVIKKTEIMDKNIVADLIALSPFDIEYKGTLLTVSIYEDKNVIETKDNKPPVRIICMVSENNKILEQFTKEAVLKYNEHISKNRGGVYLWTGEVWSYTAPVINKTMDSLFLRTETKNIIQRDLEFYKESKEICGKMGQPVRRGYLLHGKPGTGKSGAVYAFANYLDYPVYIMPSDLDAKSIEKCIYNIPSKGVLLFDDVDTCCFTHKRAEQEELKDLKTVIVTKEEVNSGSAIIKDMIESVNYVEKFESKVDREKLGILLRCLDGYNCLRECIVIMTCNYPNALDKALKRCGRIDATIEFESCNYQQLTDIIKAYSEQDDISAYLDNVDPEKFAQAELSTAQVICTIVMPNRHNPKALNKLLLSKLNNIK